MAISLHYLSNCFLVTLFLLAIAICNITVCQEPAKEVWHPKNSLATIDFDNRSGGITIVAKIGGADHKLLLDTGCTRSCLDTSLLAIYAPFESDEKTPASSPPSEKRFLQGEAVFEREVEDEIRLYQCPPMSIGGVELKSDIGVQGGRVINSPSQKGIGTDFVGILGMDQLCAFGLHIDYDNQKIILFEDVQKSGTPPGTANRLFYKALNNPTALVEVAGKRFYAIMDTGNVGEELAMKESDYKLLLASASIQDSDIQDVNHSIFLSSAKSVILHQKLAWGDNTYLPIKINPGSKWNMLGSRFLMRHRLTFDFKNNIVYVANGSYFNTKYHNDYDGIVLNDKEITHDGLEVLCIAPGSIADKAGIRPKDKLLSIGNTDVSIETLIELSRVVCTERNKDLEVKLRRDNTTLTVTLPRDGGSGLVPTTNQ